MKYPTKKFALFALPLLCAVALSGCGATAGIKPSETTCTQFLQSMQAHQYGSAYKLLSSKCKAVTSQKQLQSYWVSVEQGSGKVQSWTQTGVQFYSGTGGNSVTLNYSLTCAKSPSGVQFSCVEENNSWLIQGFKFSV